VRKTAFILLIVLVPTMAWAQAQAAGPSNPSEHPQQNPAAQGNSTSAPPSDNGAAASSGQNPDQDQKKEQSEPGQTKRMMYVVPNFAAVNANTELPPLSARGKFVLAWHDSFDYSSFVWTGIVAAQSYGLDSDPELGSGIAGYGRYYWRAFVDGVSGTYFTEAIVPAISHEDPRYYTMGHGGFFHRMGYALSRAVLTKTDSGGTSFNWSEVGGNALEAALSNAYYPPQERGGGQTATNWATQMESAALNNIAKEFWPDFRRKVLRQK
jgi:hypothetical protein